jgi:hypothetical protein
MSSSAPDIRTFTVGGPVQAEVMVVVEDDGEPALTGPCGPEPWYVEVPQGADPMAEVAKVVRRTLGPPVVLHSTSWRQSRGGVVLTFVAVMPPDAVASLTRAPIRRVDLARGEATTAPATIDAAPVIEHGLRHLAWLVHDDPAVTAALPAAWSDLLRAYVPEPFRHL